MTKSSQDIIATSWGHLCEAVYHDSWKPALGRFRTDFAFRGLSDAEYELKNSFLRNCGPNPDLEYHILRNFRKYARTSEPYLTKTPWRSLVLAQHHGLPTRLIDWTYSPFVAMHFATSNTQKFDCDGVIWKIDFVKTNRMAPPQLSQHLYQEKCNVFTVEMLEEALPSLGAFDNMQGGVHNVFFEPPSIDERIVNQYAFFSVMSSPTDSLNDWLKENPSLYRRIIIPSQLKWEVRDKLDQANITERVLFPGLDGLARWLRRHYQPVNSSIPSGPDFNQDKESDE
ncbi:MAG: FRG domain-containing protein [Candidatus Cyclobacteriaceae bacterium M3_2C_046]